MPQQPKITEDAEIDSWALQVTEELNVINNTPVDLGPLTARVAALEAASVNFVRVSTSAEILSAVEQQPVGTLILVDIRTGTTQRRVIFTDSTGFGRPFSITNLTQFRVITRETQTAPAGELTRVLQTNPLAAVNIGTIEHLRT